MEQQLIREQQIPYYPVATGKFRRYLSWQNLSDPFRVIKGLMQSYKLLKTPAGYCLFERRLRLGSGHDRRLVEQNPGCPS